MRESESTNGDVRDADPTLFRGVDTTGRGSRIAVFLCILVRKMSLEGVRHELAAWFQLVAPSVGLAIEAASLRELELGFRGQTLAGLTTRGRQLCFSARNWEPQQGGRL